ncbi:MAG TPA: ADOP family duplicated permease [Gemmatimonadaceae bacterium]|nr:ADOP family duplicated permease [Gemmatimonadaceae bacterium]
MADRSERARWPARLLDTLIADLRYALRGLRRTPAFTAAVMLTLGLGIGANVAMFSVTDRLMFRPFPYLRDPAMVHRVYFQATINGRRLTQSSGPYARYLDVRRATTSFAQYAGFMEWRLAVGIGDASRERQVAGVNAAFFAFFDAHPVLGRYFTPVEDSIPRGANVSVLSYGYWMRELGGRDVVGQKLQVGPIATTIIGVAPKGFVGVSEGEAPSVWVPITTLAYGVNQGHPETFPTKYNWDWMNVMVRRKPGVSVERANADLTRAFTLSRESMRATIKSALPANLAHPIAAAGALRTAAGPTAGLESRTLLWVDGVALTVLLLACANVLNLMLARVLSRRREIAVRLALGVSPGRLASQFVVEGMLLAALGCVSGVLIAQSVWTALREMIVRDGATDALAADWRALAVACGCAVIAGMVLSIGPAMFAPRNGVASMLRSGARQGGATSHTPRVRAALLIVQAAISVMLLVGAGLFVRSLVNARSARLGWNPDPVVVVVPNYRGLVLDSATMDATRRALLDAARAIPGVRSVARVNSMPFATSYRILFVAGIDSVQRLGRFNFQATTPDYFDVVGTRIVRGRGLTLQDRGESGRVAVVSQSMARVLWPGKEPIGQCFRIDADTVPCTRVVGVAEDVVQQNFSDAERLLYYLPDEGPLPMRPGNRIWIRFSGGDPSTRLEAVRRAVQRVMPPPGYVTVSRLEDVVDTQRRSWTLGATMFVALGVLALLVAAIGLHGVIGYAVTQRRHELGIRIALGAQSADIVRLVVVQAVAMVAVGLAIGGALALVAARWMQPLLFGESARDPAVFVVVAALVGVVSLVASAGPAMRATSADPGSVLRFD